MAQGRFIAYQPTALKVIDGRVIEADAASIRMLIDTPLDNLRHTQG